MYIDSYSPPIVSTTPQPQQHARVVLALAEYTQSEIEAKQAAGLRPGGLYIAPRMSEYFLMLSAYFDNYCELPMFYGPLDAGA